MAQLLSLDPATYQRHLIHRGDRKWVETNCYSDVVIELLHGLGFEPLAALAFTLTIDFDVDQWTFFKFPPADIEELYALGIYELAPWRPVVEHVEEEVAAGRRVLVELDSFFLPDTRGTAYQREHVKSTVAVVRIDASENQMGYFHNQSYHHLEGQDFRDVFQIDGLAHERMLPPYIEFVKPLPRAAPLRGRDLVEASLGQLDKHLRRVPERNPFLTFHEKLAGDVGWLLGAPLSTFHAYSFATLRQYGACFELAATYLRWLTEQGVDGLEGAGGAFDQISGATKTFQFQLARAVARKRALPLGHLQEMAALWERAVSDLHSRAG